MGQIATVTISAVVHSVYAITTDAVADADGYLNARLGASAWATQTTDDKKRALVSAARWIDRSINFSGTETTPGQPREWPRDGATCDGEAVTDGTVPDDIALAEFELAFILVGNSSAQDSSGQGSNIKSVAAGSASVTFIQGTTDTTRDTRLPQVAHDFLKCYFASAGLQIGASWGVSSDSAFCEGDFDRTQGYL